MAGRRHDYVDLDIDKLDGQLGKSIQISVRGPVLDGNVSPLNVAKFPQPLLECLGARTALRENKLPDTRDFFLLLRVGGGAWSKEHGAKSKKQCGAKAWRYEQNAKEAKRGARSAKRTTDESFPARV